MAAALGANVVVVTRKARDYVPFTGHVTAADALKLHVVDQPRLAVLAALATQAPGADESDAYATCGLAYIMYALQQWFAAGAALTPTSLMVALAMLALSPQQTAAECLGVVQLVFGACRTREQLADVLANPRLQPALTGMGGAGGLSEVPRVAMLVAAKS